MSETAAEYSASLATLNSPARQPTVRAPRLRVMMGGVELPGAYSAEVTNNNWFQADRFRLEFAFNADPNYGLSWWSQQTDMLLDIQMSLSAGGWVSLIIGQVEDIDTHPATGVITVTGKDLTSRLVEARTQETFLNQTASQVATTLAGRHGMTADVDATTTTVGRYYQIDHDQVTMGQFSRTTTEWDLLSYLARQEGFDLYVTGTVLHFKKATLPSATPWIVSWVAGDKGPSISNVNDLNLRRSLTLAKDIQVVVKSWHSKTGRSFQKKARAVGAKSPGAQASSNQTGTSSQQYVFIVPNLTEDEAQKLANAKLADLSKHERTISWAEPGDLTLTPRNLVRLDGTGTAFDQTYFVDEITRNISFDQGFTMHVSAKNHDSRSQVTVG